MGNSFTVLIPAEVEPTEDSFKVHPKFDDVVKPPTMFYPKKTKPFPNFPAAESDVFDNAGGRKQNFMLKLFFGRDPIDVDIVEDRFEPLRPPYHRHQQQQQQQQQGDEDLKEIQMFPPNFPKPGPSKFDMFPYESVAQPYDNSKNVNKQKQEYLNREYSFTPFFNHNEEEQKVRDADDRYDYLLDQKTRYGFDPDMRYVYHPYFGYVPTNEVNEDIMDDVVPHQLFRMHPRHGFVPALDDRPNDFYDDSDYQDRFGMNQEEMYFGKRPQIPPNANAFNYGPPPQPPPRRGEKPMMVKVIGKPETEVSQTSEESDSLSRSRRNPQVLIPQYFPVPNPFTVYQQPSMLYQPQYIYNPLVRSDLPNLRPLPLTQPIYTMSDVLNARQEAVSEVENIEEEDGDINLPVDPPGAHVANDPLPEKEFPIFPYDPEQDEPAAVAF